MPVGTAPSLDPLEALRLDLQRHLRGFLTGSRRPIREQVTDADADHGWFGPDSVTWKVHGDAAMLVGGLRALLLQTMHPLAMAGIAEHSNYRADPIHRLWRTAEYVGATTFGTEDMAEKAVRHVTKAHGRVQGIAPDGRPYSANDPHLLSWVQLTLVDSFLCAYQRYGTARLSNADADLYVAEQAVLARHIGAVAPEPPRSVAELQNQLAGFRPELSATRSAREAVRFLLAPPVSWAAKPPYLVFAAAAVGLLPQYARRALWLPRLPVTESIAVPRAVRPVVRVVDWALRPPLAG